ncbi:MAG TPA: F0F1 ATP synthase subunit B [Gemmatimonadota bacterium]|nr:F0F1 ATP synthase subunit B [Gemmatimonadota bacterium]
MNLLTPDPGLIFWTIVTFALLLAILWKFAWNPILGALDAREQAIQKTIDDAERLQEEAGKLLEEHRAQLAQARTEGNRILDEARQAGEHMKSDIMEKARSEAEKVIERAHRQLELETEQALQTIRGQTADLVLRAAEKVLERSLTDADHRRLAEEAIAEIAEWRG